MAAPRIAARKATNASAAAARSVGAGKRSKTGSPQCSQAMSAWVKSRHGGPSVGSEIHKILAKCRAMAAQNKRAASQQASGKLAEGRGTWQRSEQAAAVLAQRRAARQTVDAVKPAPKPTPKPSTPRVDDWRERLAIVRDAKIAKMRKGKGDNLTDDELDRLFPGDRPDPGRSVGPLIAALRKSKARAEGMRRSSSPEPAKPTVGISRDRLAKAREALKAPVPDALRARILDAMRSLDNQADGGAPVSLRELRTKLADVLPTKPAFDRAMKRLFDAGEVSLGRHDYPQGLKPDERAGFVRRGRNGRTAGLSGLARRNAMDHYVSASIASSAPSQAARMSPTPTPTLKPKRGKPGSPVLHSKAIDVQELRRLTERNTIIDGEDFSRHKSLRGQTSLFDRVATNDVGGKAPGRDDLARRNLAQRIKKARASGAFDRRAFDAERAGERAKHNARVDYRKTQARAEAKTQAQVTDTPRPPKPKQGRLFDRPDARALPRDAQASEKLADKLWAMGQRQKAKGDVNALGTFTRHDEMMVRLRRLSETSPKPKPKPEPEPEPSRETAPAALKRSDWRAMVESSRKRQGERRERRAARLKSVRAERSQGVRDLKPSQVLADPERFQYKLAHNKEGSVGSLSGVKKWDPERGGILQVWRDPGDGKTYVVNGHNRLDLAKRVGADKVTVRYIAARDAAEARAKGAITNIVEGRGTSIDAAKFLRDQGLTRRADFDALDLPVREKVATEGLALAALEPRAFRSVIDGDLPVERASIIGGSGLGHPQQRAILDLVAKRKNEVTNKALRELVADAREAGSKQAGGGGLFGDDPEEISLAIQRAQLVSHVKDRLSREKRVFGTVAKQRNADDLTRAGNRINTEESGKISDRAAANLAVFDRMKRLRGETSALLAEAEQRLGRGEKKDTVYADFYKRLPAALQADGA